MAPGLFGMAWGADLRTREVLCGQSETKCEEDDGAAQSPQSMLIAADAPTPNSTRMKIACASPKVATKDGSPPSLIKASTFIKELPSELRECRLSGVVAANAHASNSEGLIAGRHYTLVAVRRADNRAILTAFSKPLDAPSAGKAKVRLINAPTNEGSLSLAIA